jgi:hypothetical protein
MKFEEFVDKYDLLHWDYIDHLNDYRLNYRYSVSAVYIGDHQYIINKNDDGSYGCSMSNPLKIIYVPNRHDRTREYADVYFYSSRDEEIKVSRIFGPFERIDFDESTYNFIISGDIAERDEALAAFHSKSYDNKTSTDSVMKNPNSSEDKKTSEFVSDANGSSVEGIKITDDNIFNTSFNSNMSILKKEAEELELPKVEIESEFPEDLSDMIIAEAMRHDTPTAANTEPVELSKNYLYKTQPNKDVTFTYSDATEDADMSDVTTKNIYTATEADLNDRCINAFKSLTDADIADLLNKSKKMKGNSKS